MFMCKAWYIDDEEILEGTYMRGLFRKYFIPKGGIACGFSSQRIYKNDVGETLHFSEELAKLKLKGGLNEEV